jgi:hypothetical protein
MENALKPKSVEELEKEKEERELEEEIALFESEQSGVSVLAAPPTKQPLQAP